MRQTRLKKERAQWGKRMRREVLGLGSGEVGVLARSCGSVPSCVYQAAGGGRSVHAGEGVEGEERSVRLQGVPVGVGTGTTGMG